MKRHLTLVDNHFKPTQPYHGPVHNKRLDIVCNACGNRDRFYGRAITEPIIMIERQSANQYDVTEMTYSSHETVNEIIEKCANCGAERGAISITKLPEQE